MVSFGYEYINLSGSYVERIHSLVNKIHLDVIISILKAKQLVFCKHYAEQSLVDSKVVSDIDYNSSS